MYATILLALNLGNMVEGQLIPLHGKEIDGFVVLA
jgi:hypothetical protein